MKMSHKFQLKSLFAAVLLMTVPVWGVQAFAPEMPLMPGDFLAGNQAELIRQSLSIEDFHYTPEVPSQIEEDIVAVIESINPSLGVQLTEEEIAVLPVEELEVALQDELLIPAEKEGFWTKRRVIGAVILGSALIFALILLFAGSGGGGSGGGSGSGSGDEGTGTGEGFDGFPAGGVPPGQTGPQGGTGTTGTTGTTGGSNDYPGIPNNPEPSSMMLLGFGLLIPYLRKKAA